MQIEQSQTDYVKRLKVAHVACKARLSFHTRFFFKHQYNKKFIVSDHHKQIWSVLERVLSGELTKVMINMPPRYGKTEIAVKNFISHGLALNAAAKFIHLSYSKTLALDNSEAVKDIVKLPEYQLLFPEVKVKPKSDSKEKWYTTANGGIYATATGGQVTGFGAGAVDEEDDFNIEELDEFLDYGEQMTDVDVYGEKANFKGALIIDDPMKPEDADSDTRRERINERFNSTIRNRVNSRKTPIIIIMQRLHEDDLCGFLLREEPDEWFVLTLPAIIDEDTANERPLWEFKHSLPELKKMIEVIGKTIFQRQMQQNPMPKEGLMYGEFELYGVLPITVRSVRKNYTDTADEGDDFLCSISYTETEEGMYVTDVYYTDEGMKTTQPETARRLTKQQITVCRVEYNNGGIGFKREVERQTRLLKNYRTIFTGFTQKDNKDVRIFQKSAEVTNMIKMPIGWDKMWPKFYKAVTEYSKTGKNAHDDGPDTLTGMCEFFGKDSLNQNTDWATALR